MSTAALCSDGTARLGVDGLLAGCCDAPLTLLGCCFGGAQNEVGQYPPDLIADPAVGLFSSNRMRLGSTGILTNACVYIDTDFGVNARPVRLGIDPQGSSQGTVLVNSPFGIVNGTAILAERREVRGSPGPCQRYLFGARLEDGVPRYTWNRPATIPLDAFNFNGFLNASYSEAFGVDEQFNTFSMFVTEQRSRFTFIRSLVEQDGEGSAAPIRACGVLGELEFDGGYRVFPGYEYRDTPEQNQDLGEFLTREEDGLPAAGMVPLRVRLEFGPFEIAYLPSGKPVFRLDDTQPGGYGPTPDGRCNVIGEFVSTGGDGAVGSPITGTRYASSDAPENLPEGVQHLTVTDASAHDRLDITVRSTGFDGPLYGTLGPSSSGGGDPGLGTQMPYSVAFTVRMTSDAPLFDCGCLEPDGTVYAAGDEPAACPVVEFNETECEGWFRFYNGTPLDEFDGEGPIPRPDPIPPDGDGGGGTGPGGGIGSAPNCPDPEEVTDFGDLIDADPRCYDLFFDAPERIPFPGEGIDSPLVPGEVRRGKATRRSVVWLAPGGAMGKLGAGRMRRRRFVRMRSPGRGRTRGGLPSGPEQHGIPEHLRDDFSGRCRGCGE